MPALAIGSAAARPMPERSRARDIPRGGRNLGTLAIFEPESAQRSDYELGSTAALLRMFVERSGCFTMTGLPRGLDADGGQAHQIQPLYFLQPDLSSGKQNSGGSSATPILGGLMGGSIRGIVANVTLRLVDARTMLTVAQAAGQARQADAAGVRWLHELTGAGGYANNPIGRVAALAYLDAYIKLIDQMGGLSR